MKYLERGNNQENLIVRLGKPRLYCRAISVGGGHVTTQRTPIVPIHSRAIALALGGQDNINSE
ncbi:MAG: hypothetical protein QNJ72_28700 [Pleurocapsa sp. MO_226.B13]|nr:hypothetical protein [Pleurocapsa sp. MO_226.B13]